MRSVFVMRDRKMHLTSLTLFTAVVLASEVADGASPRFLTRMPVK